ncbi:hypothetical protein CONCODRAFT_84895 [Conidiobolus coronatus NRRL 28638]|uniref:Uncharacterized protein n=1 Tax=Conidiobolus coronatus (strain ATCC 28846 / CBS 209.66 / NRRL 28638) TaxID=796925 RepID=A0A137P7S0_CONC2|nr:hypothetical protein CONCODRAFT_84895 [Conidiobolus coronatus NRRL 28638]|eukprot:KXN71050.1 hypothetical protein CONCODRAFT_84895 [Conidiobolus coronatus NRRL 28638]
MAAPPNYYCFNNLSYPCQPIILPPIKYPSPITIRPPVSYPTATYTPPAPTYAPAPPSDDACNSAKYKNLIGSTYNPGTKTFTQGYSVLLTADQLPKPNLILTPGSITTMDFIENRLRVYYDDGNKNVVTDLRCG